MEIMAASAAFQDSIINPDEPILVTGASGFIGPRVVEGLLNHGFRNLRCLMRPGGDSAKLAKYADQIGGNARVEIVRGNLLSREDCLRISQSVAVVYHLAAARGEKSVPDAFMNSVVTTRNLLDACRQHGTLKRFVTLSSFSVYSNDRNGSAGRAATGALLDESCPVETHPARRNDAYTFAKTKQDEIVTEYGKKFGIPYVIVRPGFVYGPGNEAISGRVGIGSFGIFLHLGGSNTIPFTYVDNCAEAIILAGLRKGINGEAFNVVDDELPSSREFLRLYKKNVRNFRSLYIPHAMSYSLCWLWEKYSQWSEGQLPPTFNRSMWCSYWKKARYTNAKAKTRLGWTPKVSSSEAMQRYFESCRRKLAHA
jgi:nucleoside-diphosphate-sugar epimerase